ncbi:unnamed protein product [Phytophthora fragariaefolia]|uniref:Unnamed protein product n=1 Tax=Phytophthora fragariaefolia TaxID=1490495 RepID=A0A9W6XN45_9STRA|nr:unnamed protein product [Phytophthora fragariaefolia]
MRVKVTPELCDSEAAHTLSFHARALDKHDMPVFPQQQARRARTTVSFHAKQLLATVVSEADGLSKGHKDTKAILQRVDAMKNSVAMFESKVEGVKARLEESLRMQQYMDTVAKDAKTLMRNLTYTIEEMDDEVEQLRSSRTCLRSVWLLLSTNSTLCWCPRCRMLW